MLPFMEALLYTRLFHVIKMFFLSHVKIAPAWIGGSICYRLNIRLLKTSGAECCITTETLIDATLCYVHGLYFQSFVFYFQSLL